MATNDSNDRQCCRIDTADTCSMKNTVILWKEGDPYKVALFYRYVQIENCEALVEDWRQKCSDLCLLGRILISKEGINGTLAGSPSAVEAFVVYVTNSGDRFRFIDWKFSLSDSTHTNECLPFLGLSIRIVDEIVSSGSAKTFIENATNFESASYGGLVGTGVHLTPHEFHDAVMNKKGVVLDIRNEFEHDIGHFDKAVNLKTFTYAETFQALDRVLADCTDVATSDSVLSREDHIITNCNESSASNYYSNRDESEPNPAAQNISANCNYSPAASSGENIYMYCTGGIRCEKASAYLRAKGFRNVYQLEGGIHRYLEAYPDGGAFHGKNFVFDSRVAVGPVDINTPSSNTELRKDSCVDDEFKRMDIVGSCIDCNAPYDVYSGYIVCTVCRMPVLVCPSCVELNTHPGEYHCHRHRDLKDCYFTVLGRYSVAELEQHKRKLMAMLEESSVVKGEKRKQLKEVRRQQYKELFQHKDSEKIDSSHADDPSSHEVQSNDITHASGRHRRRTLRKQIERIEKQMIIASSTIAGAQHEVVSHEHCTKKDDIVVEDRSNFISNHTSLPVSITNAADNPQTRGRWGFWQS